MENIREFIFENKPTASCHASTVLPLADGRVVAAWFAGTKESADDVDILTSVRGENGWSEPVRVSADVKVPHWNPVLFEREDGKIMLFFKVGKKIPMWKTYFSLSDNGVDWTEPAELVPEDIGGGRGPVKNKPIRLRSGRVIAPASDERNTLWVCFVDISDDDCRTWKRMRTVPTKSLRGFYVPMIQPTLWQSEDGGVHMLTRTSRGRIYRSDSSDEGETWCMAYRTKLPNNNSGIDLVGAENGKLYLVCNPTLWVCFVDISDDDCRTWKRMRTVPTKSLRGFYVPMIQPTLWQSEDGGVHMLTRTSRGRIYRSDSSDEGETWCMAYRTKLPNNNSGIDLVGAENGKLYLVCNPVKKNWGSRSPLDLLVSEDGGKTFTRLLRLEDREGGEFSYPAITERDGILHITYTYDREHIAYRQIKL